MNKHDIRTSVEAFLQQKGLAAEILPASEDSVTKAGVVPYVYNPQRQCNEYLVMKPQGSKPELGPPPFQICKGTRMCKDEHGQWWDMKGGFDYGGVRETLLMTALREGVEELGIRLTGIQAMVDLGIFDFGSASRGAMKQMHLFALAVQSRDMLLPMEEVESSTAERSWVLISGFHAIGRSDHIHILDKIDDIMRQRGDYANVRT